MGWLDDLVARRVLFVGGKGGVGKTTLAASLGLAAAARGRRTLLASTDPAHSLGDVVDRRIGGSETPLATGLTALEIDPEVEAERHIGGIKRDMRALVRPALYAEVDRQLDLARDAPGAGEAALLERIAGLMAEAPARFDLVIFDTAPTGHTLRLLTAPELMTAWTDALIRNRERADRLSHVLKGFGGGGGPGDDLSHFDQSRPVDSSPLAQIHDRLVARRRRFETMRAALTDPAETGFVLVLVPERLPLRESEKARALLRRFGIEVACAVVNRVLPDDAEGAFLATRRERERAYLDDIDRSFHDLPRPRVPLAADDVVGLDALGRLAEAWG